jgi:hypothetical protein
MWLGPGAALHAQAADAAVKPGAPAACNNILLPPRDVKGGKKVGPSSCEMRETAISYQGKPYVRLDIGLDGSVEGWLAKEGDYKDYFTNGPDLVFPQTWGKRDIFFGIAKYERAKGAAMVVIYPADKAAWNGRIYVTNHGRGVAFKTGSLKPWDKMLDPASPTGDLDKYERQMIAKGYALVKTRRTTTEGIGEITAVLEDGSTVDSIAFNDTVNYIKDFADVARGELLKRLGKPPVHVYSYGHSAGARVGHGLNYVPGLNLTRDGKRYFDGILNDDPAAGTWHPVVMKDGKDILFQTAEEKAKFVPMIDVAHQMYNNIWPPQHPDWLTDSYLGNKRWNARVLRDKGLTKYRMYEVRSVSHSGGEGWPDGVTGKGELEIINLSLAMDKFIDMLDAWVDKGTEPPVTRSDWAELGDVNKDGVIENPALSFPEITCPLGTYYNYPETVSGTTAFAPFTGKGLEPLNTKNVWVDMNRNGVWDFRETPSQAWQRLGLLKANEPLTQEKYAACVTKAANELRTAGFFSEKTALWYAEQAKTTSLQPKPSAADLAPRPKSTGGAER